jgi:hypothetical protein
VIFKVAGSFTLYRPAPGSETKEVTMLNLKTLTTGAIAATLVSVIGLAYAQSTTTQPDTSTTTPAATMPATPMPTPMEPATTVAPRTTMPDSTRANDALNGTMAEPQPKADRN